MSKTTPSLPRTGWLNRLFQTFISPHPSVSDEPEQYKAELLAGMSLSFAIIVVSSLLATVLSTGVDTLVIAGMFFAFISFVTYILSRTPYYKQAPFVFITGFALLAYIASSLGNYPALFLTLTFAVLFLLTNLLDFKWLTWTILINTIVAFILSSFMSLDRQEVLNLRAGIVSIGLFVILFAWYRENLEHLRLTEANLTRKEVEVTNIELKKAREMATERLEEVRLAAEVGRTISEEHSLDAMLANAVKLIRTRFSLYYVQVYLTNNNHTALILQAGTGAVGKELINRAHRLPLNLTSINGRAAMERRSVVVEDTATSITFTVNLLLPNTKSEMAIPLLVRDKMVGVLNMQSDQAGFLNKDILPAFEALAGQLAVAIENARLLTETEQAHKETEAQAQQLSRVNWKDYLDAIHKPEEVGLVYEKSTFYPLSGENEISDNTLMAPIKVTGEMLGHLAVSIEGKPLIGQASDLLNNVAEQVAQQIESLRLFEISERYRFEAEEATRRLTRDTWENYQKEKENLAFLYKDAQVQPLVEDEDFIEKQNYKIKINNETIGEVNIAGTDVHSEENSELIASITEQLSAHLENLRLNEATEEALSETESLYNASREITAARDMDEVANTLVKYIDHSQLDRVVVALIDENVKDEMLTEVRAIWDRAGKLKAGNIFTATQMPILEKLGPHDILIVDDFSTTEDVDEASKAVFAYLEVKSAAIIPISVGELLFGWILLETTKAPRKFSAVDMNPFEALAGQAGVVLESQRLLRQSQNRAEREQALGKITSAIRSSTDPRTILRTTVRELGTILGRRAMIQMTMQTKEEKDK